MLVQVTTDNHINSHDDRVRGVEDQLTAALERFGEQITRVDVHLKDANGQKHGSDDKHCLIEAHLAGHQPVVASHDADSLDEAIDVATHKLERALDHLLDRLGHKKGRTSMGGDQTI